MAWLAALPILYVGNAKARDGDRQVWPPTSFFIYTHFNQITFHKRGIGKAYRIMERCLIGLSFDDGRIDNYTLLRPLLERYNLPATFNITTGYVLGKLNPGNPTDVKPMDMDMVKALNDNPLFEIAGHGWAHKNSIEDIHEGFDDLKHRLGVEKLTELGDGFASPGTGLATETWQKLTAESNSDLKYARVSLRYTSHAKLKTLIRKVSRLTKCPLLYRLAYQDTLMDGVEDGKLYSVPVLASITINELKALIDYSVKHRKACVLMFHSIVPDGQVHDNWDYEESIFSELCQYLKEGESRGTLQVCKSIDIWNALKD